MPEGRDIEAAMGARDNRAAAEVEAAGGMEGAGVAGADLANALADALAAGYEQGSGMEYGAVATEDLSGFDEDESDYAADMEAQRVAAAAVAAPATGVVDDFAGYTQAGLAPSAYAAGQKYGGEQPSVETFGQRWQTASPDTSRPYDANEFVSAQNAPNLATGQELFGGYQGAVAQGYNFDQTQQGHPDFQGVQSVGTGVESFANNPYAEISGTGTGGPGMAAPLGQGQMQGGLLSAATGIPAGTTTMAGSGAGAITAGTTAAGGVLEDQTIETDIARGTLTQDAGQDALPVNFVNQKVADIAAKTNTPEANTAAHRQVMQERLDWGKILEEKAKTDRYGRIRDSKGNQTIVNNGQLASAYRAFDPILAAYNTIHGQGALASLITNNLPGVNMATELLGSITQGLINRGIFGTATGKEISDMIAENLAAGLRPGDASIWESGPSTEDVEGPKEISAFIQQYPWAAELDPRYIKYLIDNPPALQDLLGQA